MADVQLYCLLMALEDERRIEAINQALVAADLSGPVGFALADQDDCGGPRYFEGIIAYDTSKNTEPDAVRKVLNRRDLHPDTLFFYQHQDETTWTHGPLKAGDTQRFRDEVSRTERIHDDVLAWMGEDDRFSVTVSMTKGRAHLTASDLDRSEAADMIMELHRENWKEANRYWQDDEFIGWLVCNKTIVLHRGSLPQVVELAAARRRARTTMIALPSVSAHDAERGGSDA